MSIQTVHRGSFIQRQYPRNSLKHKVHVIAHTERAFMTIAAVDPNMSVTEAFRVADDVLRSGVRGISDIITVGTRAFKGLSGF